MSTQEPGSPKGPPKRRRKLNTNLHPAIHDRRFDKKKRACINCSAMFNSIGPGNRTCPACRRQLADTTLPTTHRSEVREDEDD